MGKKSREKGKRGERQARDWWREVVGVGDARRVSSTKVEEIAATLQEYLSSIPRLKSEELPLTYITPSLNVQMTVRLEGFRSSSLEETEKSGSSSSRVVPFAN
jgi:hypothetical protein